MLNLACRGLSTWPSVVRLDARLVHLYLNDNQLTELPEAIGRLRSLWQLFVHDNRLRSLPSAIGQLRCLWELDAHSNQLTALPHAICKCSSLRRLDLSNNLFSLTTTLGWLGRVRSLRLEGAHNPGLQLPPASVVVRGLEAGEQSKVLGLTASDLQIGRSIAEGEFAEVFRGLLWGQRVAVKQLKPKRPKAELDKELEHETRLTASLSHPAVLTLIGYTEEPPQMVLEHLEGTLYDLVRDYEALEKAGGLVAPLLDVVAGCAYLHARQPPLLHRDLKPPNVLYDERRRCKLCDFGTALELPPEAPRPTECIGSALYLAPEVEKEAPYGLPADVFSFAVMCFEVYHLEANGVDFYGDGDLFEGGGLLEGLEIVRTPLAATPQEMPERPSSCDSDAVWELLSECMKVEPEARPTFAQVAARLSAAKAKTSDWL